MNSQQSTRRNFVLQCGSASALVLLQEAAPAQEPDRERGTTLRVSNEEELRRAATQSARQSVNIVIDRLITIQRGIQFPTSSSVVRLTGTKPEAGLDIKMRFGGDWSRVNETGGNALQFNCRHAIIRNLKFSGFETVGSVIKGHVSELLDVAECQFVDIGTVQFPFKVARPATADDSIYNQCIGAHNLENARISVVKCRFERCALNNRSWSHCLYTSARSVLVQDNEFVECGSPFAVGPTPNGAAEILGNRILRPAAVTDRRGNARPTYLMSVGRRGKVTFKSNVVEGRMEDIWTGQPSPEFHSIDDNDYKDLAYSGMWAADTTREVAISWDEWKKMGFDRNSKAPKQHRGR